MGKNFLIILEIKHDLRAPLRNRAKVLLALAPQEQFSK